MANSELPSSQSQTCWEDQDWLARYIFLCYEVSVRASHHPTLLSECYFHLFGCTNRGDCEETQNKLGTISLKTCKKNRIISPKRLMGAPSSSTAAHTAKRRVPSEKPFPWVCSQPDKSGEPVPRLSLVHKLFFFYYRQKERKQSERIHIHM